MTLIEEQAQKAGQIHQRRNLVLLWIGLSIFFYLAFFDFYQNVVALGNPLTLASRRQLVFFIGLAIFCGVWFFCFSLIWNQRFPAWLVHLVRVLDRICWKIPLALRGLVAVLLVFLPSYLFLYSSFGNYHAGVWFRIFTQVASACLVLLLLFKLQTLKGTLLILTGLVLLCGAVYQACGWLNQVSDYPFSMGWSEGNRFWDYSMLFGSGRYMNPTGAPVYSFISVGRQFLWAIPFLFPGTTIWMERLWDALTWILPGLFLGWVSVWRLPKDQMPWYWKTAIGLWSFVFISQGPVYAPLLVSAVVAVVGLRQRKLWIGMLLVLVASYYASISRFTWSYAPGLWAGLLAFLELPNPSLSPKRWRELIRPVGLGLAGYVGGQYVKSIIQWIQTGFQSANLSIVIDPSSTIERQPLLWERLLPNSTYPPGILLGLLWAGLAVVLFLAALRLLNIWKINRLQTLAVIVILLAFFAIGLTASVKIGGGSNLHNLDMFIVSLVLVTIWALKNIKEQLQSFSFLPKAALILLVVTAIMPITYNNQYGSPLGLPPDDIIQSSLALLQKRVAEYNQKGEILFMDQRQLLTFGYIKDVPLVGEYEKKLLMDQAMANNASYFKQFHEDLKNKRFVLIVTEPLKRGAVNPDERNFAEENNAWVKWVSRPVLENYKELISFDVGVQLLVPRK